jgi:hypothetical protein
LYTPKSKQQHRHWGSLLLKRRRARKSGKLFAVFPKADTKLATLWYAILFLREVLPVALAIAMGSLVQSEQLGAI